MTGFGRLAANNVAIRSLAGNSETTSPIKHINIEEICPRFENKYIANIDKSKSLIESIKSAGLIEPINVIPIGKYIDYCEKHLNSGKEVEYLSSMLEKGIKYFISSGHRRFKAYISITLGLDIVTDEEWAQNFDSLKKVCKSSRNASLAAMLGGSVESNMDEKWTTIPAIVIEKDFEKEEIIYNDSNTTQRELTGFEIIVNSIDEMKKNGTYSKIITDAVRDRVAQMTDRKVREKTNDLVKSGTLCKDCANKTIEEQREELLKQKFTDIPGTEAAINKKIIEYIKVEKQRNVSMTNVNNTRKIIEKFDTRLLQQIYDGKLTFKMAKEVMPVYDQIDIESTVEAIKDGKFKIENIKKTPKKLQFTNRQLVDLIYEVRNGVKTIDEVVELIEKNEN